MLQRPLFAVQFRRDQNVLAPVDWLVGMGYFDLEDALAALKTAAAEACRPGTVVGFLVWYRTPHAAEVEAAQKLNPQRIVMAQGIPRGKVPPGVKLPEKTFAKTRNALPIDDEILEVLRERGDLTTTDLRMILERASLNINQSCRRLEAQGKLRSSWISQGNRKVLLYEIVEDA